MATQDNLTPDFESDRKQLLDHIETLIEDQEFQALKQVLAESRSSDIAEIAEVLDELARQILFDVMDPEEAGEVLGKMDEASRGEVVEEMSHQDLGEIISTLPPDEAADVVGDLSEEQSQEFLEHIRQTPSGEQLGELLKYEEDTAGGLMTPVLLKASIEATVAETIEVIRRADPKEDFYFVFIVDAEEKLVGTVGVRTLLRHRLDEVVGNVMKDNPLMVNINADQEEIATIFRKHDLVAIGVVDDQGKLAGRITVDDIIDVMGEEADEDALVMAGTHPTELETHGLFRAASVRLPWLLVCMTSSIFFGCLLQSVFVDLFASPVWISVLFFMPAIAAMGGNSGLQTSTIVVRGLATGDLAALDLVQVFSRESRVALIVALFCGVAAGGLSTLFLTLFPGGLAGGEAWVLGMSVGAAMFFGIMLSTTLGFLLPFLFRKIGIDPALSSGPLVTTANDALGCLCYFSLSLLFISLLT